MTSIAVLFISICLLASHHIRALPPINFTDTILTNRMIEALNEALVTRDGEQLSPFQQLRQHLYQQQQHVPEQQYYPQAPVAYPQHTPEQQQPSHSFFPDQQPAHSFFPEQPQQQPSHPFYPQQIPDQQQPTHSFYPQQLPEQQQPFYPQQLPDQQQQQQQLYQQHLLEQQAFNQQQQQQQHTQPPHHFEHVFPPVSQPTLPPMQHPTQPAHSSFLPAQQQQQQHPLQPTHPSYLPEQQQQQQHPLPPTHPSYLPEQQQQQQQPASNQPDSPGYYYPYPYQNINWYNFANLWPGVTNANPNPVAPVAHTGSQTSGSTTSNDCPVGFCPKGGSCSQLSGQWQCGCNTNDCVGVANPCGIFGQYYFPYYPDATRFIQCDQTGVFWIRRCGPGTIFDPKISVCNYPPVVVETGKK